MFAAYRVGAAAYAAWGPVRTLGAASGLKLFAGTPQGQEALEIVEGAILPMGSPSGFKPRTWQEAGISPGDAARIQAVASKTGQRVRVFGSRAEGRATNTSDWDYVLYGANAKIRDKAKQSLPRGASGGELTESGRPTGADFLRPDKYTVQSDYVDFDP
jgi:hypothetical protein